MGGMKLTPSRGECRRLGASPRPDGVGRKPLWGVRRKSARVARIGRFTTAGRRSFLGNCLFLWKGVQSGQETARFRAGAFASEAEQNRHTRGRIPRETGAESGGESSPPRARNARPERPEGPCGA